MKLFQKAKQLLAPASGTLVALADLPDPAFAEGMLGEGIAIDPDDGNLGSLCRFCSPCKGEVAGVTDTAHAYNILTDDGLELLLHIGIDTVELKGKGFFPKVKAGDRIDAGDLLVEVDLSVLREGVYSTLTPLIVTNPDALTSLEPASMTASRRVECGKDAVLRYEIANEK